MSNTSLGKLLVVEGLLTEADRQTIRRTCGVAPSAFAKGILALGILEEDELTALLADKTNFPIGPKDLMSEHDSDVFRAIDPLLAARLEVFPLGVQKDSIRVAVTDPLDRNIIRQLEFFTEKKIKPVIAPLSEIRRCLAKVVRGFQPQPTDLEAFLIHHAPSASRQLASERNPYLRRAERKPSGGAAASSIRIPGQYTSSERDDRFASIDIGPDFNAPPLSRRDRELESLSFLNKSSRPNPFASDGDQLRESAHTEAKIDIPAEEFSASVDHDEGTDPDLLDSKPRSQSNRAPEIAMESDLDLDLATESDAMSADTAQATDDSNSAGGDDFGGIKDEDLEDLGDLDLGQGSGNSADIDLTDLDDIGAAPARPETETAATQPVPEAATDQVELGMELADESTLDASIESAPDTAESAAELGEMEVAQLDEGAMAAEADFGETSLEKEAAADAGFEFDTESSDGLTASEAPDLLADLELAADLVQEPSPDLGLDAAPENFPDIGVEHDSSGEIGALPELGLDAGGSELMDDPKTGSDQMPSEDFATEAAAAIDSVNESPVEIEAAPDDKPEAAAAELDPTQVLSTLNQAMIRCSLSAPGPQNLQTIGTALAKHLPSGAIFSSATQLVRMAEWRHAATPLNTKDSIDAKERSALQIYLKSHAAPWLVLNESDAAKLPASLSGMMGKEEAVVICALGSTVLVTSCSLDLAANEAFQLAVQTLIKKLEKP
jgi:hypothetical protein